ncbi:protein BIG GRAIN 1-like A [Quillaja saponaria]|uniref:Protein BIG GRAIN 1-like A n=1 Tax=Quillaja saponaria TaxID=32244 RepID=A0AAD7QD42_QUISA|nr:protein BIG GRAIN 1-like A [Quillaja saponaria]
MYRRERSSIREGSVPQRKRTPSFSSSLLDAIYNSIDESKSNLDENQQLGLYKETHKLKQSNFSYNHGGGKERMNLRRAVMIEDWMEKQSSQSHSSNSSGFFNSTSSSSESSYGGLFSSSSETERSYKLKSRPKSERPQMNMKQDHRNSEKKEQQEKSEHEGGFARTKLRALKIYGELNKKVKQPISPGGRIATFLNSIFNSGNVKKAKMCYVGAVEDVSFEHKSKSPCFSSSASSFSRSCMSKTPSSARGNSNNGVKRSVRFYPDSVILGEEHSQSYENDPSLMPLPSMRKLARSSTIKELKNHVGAQKPGIDFIKGYKNQNVGKFDFRDFYNNGDVEDDDAESYSSSDLFELDHHIGIGRYQEELPVYETTNLKTNKAIANGFLF